MTDRLQELRDRADLYRGLTDYIQPDDGPSIMEWAADEIERLRAVIAESLRTLDDPQWAPMAANHSVHERLTAALKGTTDDR